MEDQPPAAPPAPVVAARARVTPASVNHQDRSVEVIWTTGARAVNVVPGVGRILEELDLSPGAVRMDVLRSGNAPVLDQHRRASSRDVIGRVAAARIEGGRGIATLQFSTAADAAPIWERVADGTIRTVSVGYAVHRYQPIADAAAGTVHRAVDWEPFEISIAPIPVDPGAVVRADSLADTAPAFVAVETAEPEPAAVAASKEQTMADNPQPAAPDAPAAVTEDMQAARSAAIQAERTRIASLDEPARLARAQGMDDAELGRLSARARDEGWDAAAFRAALFDAMVVADRARPAPAPVAVSQFGRSFDDPAVLVDAMGTALAARAMPAVAQRSGEGKWREFVSLRPSDMIMELAAARGERVSPRDRVRLVERAFHTTSDFPLLLENAGNKMLEAGFAAAAPSYRMIFAQRPFNDFKAHSFLTAGDFPIPTELAEGGQIAAGTISEKRERITPKTYARQVRVTRQMLVNDDLGAFSDFGTMIGRRVADFENATAYALLNTASGDGPTLATGSAAVFGTGASRVNKASAGAAITETTLDTGFAGIMAQSSIDGVKLNLQPAYLLTGAAYRGAALRYTTRAISPSAAANVAIYDMLTPVADANIPGNRWYLFADPAVAPVYVYGYVNGQTAPQIRVHQYIPGTDGMAVEVVHDFAVGAIDHRGGWFNPGA